MGIDISEKALKKAKEVYPDIKTVKVRVEDIDFGYKRFDLAVSNAHFKILPREISRKSCRMIYINELTESDGVPERVVIYKHNYEELFKQNGFKIIEKGRLDKQTWMLFLGDK